MTALTGPIGRLRGAGCKVSTIIGHDPNIGSFLYRVSLPDGIPTGAQSILGHAHCSDVRPSEGPGRVLIWASVYRLNAPLPDKQLRNAAEVDTARALERLADHVENYDRVSGLSRQHYIETGQYLTRQDAAETVTVNVGTASRRSVECVIGALGGHILHEVPTEGTCGYITLTIQKGVSR